MQTGFPTIEEYKRQNKRIIELTNRVAELEAENTRLGELAENQGREIKRLHFLLEPQP